MASYKVYDHPLRNKMIIRVCVEIYNLNPECIPVDINQKLCFITYQEIIKPLAINEFKKNTTAGELAIKYGVTAQVMRGILGIST